MAFTLAISAASAPACRALVRAALDTDPRVMPVAGPARVTWRAADERAAMLGFGTPAASMPRSAPCSIWADPGREVIHAKTGIANVDPVYVAELPGAVVMSDRASWAAAVAGRLDSPDPALVAALVNLGFPLGGVTPFRGVRAVDGGRQVEVRAGRLTVRAAAGFVVPAVGPRQTASALTDAVAPLAEAAVPVELSLTGGKDSRLIAAALSAAKVPFRARTHGAATHPDVVVARTIAEQLGVEHLVTEPPPPGTTGPAGVLARLRSAVLVGDGMLSAFENMGRPDPVFAAEPIQVGGHGGELLRGGYAAYAGNPLRGAAQFRRLTTRRLRLLTPAAAGGYLAGLAPWAVRFARTPMHTLDEFYLANRAGRWSAAARQAYRLRSEFVQPFFDDRVVRTARSVPLRDRVSGKLHRDLLAELCPELTDIPYAGRGFAARADWRRSYGDDVAAFLRDYVLDHSSAMSGMISKGAAERVLRPPHTDHESVWLLATLATLLSQDWLRAREGGLCFMSRRSCETGKSLMTDADVLLTGLGFGESPRWHDGRLWLSNWGTQEVLAVDMDGKSEVVARIPTTIPYSIDWLPDGRLLAVSGPEGIVLRREPDGTLVTHADLTSLGRGFNEIVVDGRGNIYVNGAIIVHISPSGAIRQVADGLAWGNGMAITPDDGTLIVAESHGKRLTAFDIAPDGGLSGRRIWADCGDGVPDGICIDGEGAVWYADVPNKRCVRVRAGGEVLETVEVDRGCFACMLGGPDGRTLFIAAAEWRGMENASIAMDARTGQLLTFPAPAPHAGHP